MRPSCGYLAALPMCTCLIRQIAGRLYFYSRRTLSYARVRLGVLRLGAASSVGSL